jgi:ABC-2 type transport system ATP-binding protein
LDPLNQQVLEVVIREQAAAGHAVLFSTHTMQHAERLCERLLILDKGAMRFEGTLAKARAAMPRRVRIEADGDMSFLARVRGVTSVTPPHGAEPVWEVHLEQGADPRAILAACFEAGVALRRFDASEASLHEIFVSLVGAQEGGE